MKITKEVIRFIFQDITSTPPEIGGVLGSTKEVIDHVVKDKGIPGNISCCYTPNVEFLNQVIKEWQNAKIEFKGIFHSHYFGVDTLSQGDYRYIKTIMKSMPLNIDSLYFPVAVMPKRELVVYNAYKCKNKINIIREKIEIL